MKSTFQPCPNTTLRTRSHKSVGGFHLAKCEYSKQHLILQHMMAHYRRVYTAKCDVDTSTPTCFKPRYKPKPRPPLPTPLLPVQSQLTRDDIRFLESLAGDIRSWWTGKDIRHPLQHPEPKVKVDHDINNPRHQIQCPMPEKDSENQEWCLYEQQYYGNEVDGVSPLRVRTVPKNAKEADMKRCSLACQTLATSKLREMSVYHPPRRKVAAKDSRSSHKVCSQNASKNSKKGSHSCLPGNYSGSCRLYANEVGSVIEQQKEELLYLQFVQDITHEILSNNIYCNEGVNRVFAKHVYLNKGKLRMDKMRGEIENLRKQIGIPRSKCSLFTRGHRRFSNPSVMKEITKIVDRDELEDSGLESQETKSFYAIPNKICHSKGNVCPSVQSTKEMEETEPSEDAKKTNVLGLLQEMGFDNKMAEEICLCMTEKDITKFHFAQNESVTNDYWLPDFINANQMNEKEDLEKPKCGMDFYSGFLLGKGNTAKTGFFLNEKEMMEEGRISDSFTTDRTDTTEDFPEFVQAIISGDGRTSKGSGESASTFGIDVGSESDFMEHSKSNFSQERNETTLATSSSIVTSPLGSDYSSMKDNNESACEDSSNVEEPDEGRESISEIEEEIPEEISQSSSSSGISQLTERLKKCSVNTVHHSRTSERKNLTSEDNTGHLKTLIL